MISKNLMVSVSILLFFFSFEITNAMSRDLTLVAGNSTMMEITPPQTHTNTPLNVSTGWAGALDSLLDTSGNVYEAQGGSLGVVSQATFIKNVLINSTTGFYAFIHTLLGITPGPTAISTLIGIVNFMVILNHGFAIIQVISKLLGG
jgi:hypothetical protein